MKNSPCMDCKERSLNCHALCGRYKDWVVGQQKLREARAKALANERMSTMKEKSLIKIMKKGAKR